MCTEAGLNRAAAICFCLIVIRRTACVLSTSKRADAHQESCISSYRFFCARASLKMPDHVYSKCVGQGDINALGELVEPEYASSTGT